MAEALPLTGPFVPRLFPAVPDHAPELLQRCSQEIEQTFATGIVERLLPGRSGALLTVMRRQLRPLAEALCFTGTVQKGIVGDREDNRIFIKVRLSETGVETLVSKVLGIGAYKKVWGVVRCSGGALEERGADQIYAYAKSPLLIEARKKLREYHKMQCSGRLRLGALKVFAESISALRQTVSSIQDDFCKEIEISLSAPDAVCARSAWRRRHPGETKGIKMEYIDEGDLFCFSRCCPFPRCSSVLISLASRVCFAVARTHEANVLHGDIKSPNVLLKGDPGAFEPLLCDFMTARTLPSDALCSERESTYAPPEMCSADERPVPYDVSMDNWSLGSVVIDAVYGVDVTERILNRDTGACLPWDEVQRLLQAQPLRCSGVDRVIENLMRVNPRDRWTARQAAEELHRIAEVPLR
jgi:hypothetical protein